MNSIIHGFKNKEVGEINIKAYKEDSNLILVYKDNGIGLDDETKEKIFDPFYTTNRANGGSGLGMNIVFNLITQKLNGTIKLNSQKNNGIEFILNIPI
jgi:signal transduction histidine kinase